MRPQPVDTEAEGLPARLFIPGLIDASYAAEMSLFSALPSVPQPAAHLLAARAAGSFLAVQPAAVRHAEPDTTLAATCMQLAASAAPDRLCDSLDQQSAAMVRRLWPLAAATESLLAQGGDERLTLDPVTGLNRYLCAPYPRPDVLAFGSCTASSISPSALQAAEQRRREMLQAAAMSSAENAIEAATQFVTDQLLSHLNSADIADAMLVASGTDAALLITALIAARHSGQPITSILMSPSETGSGVPEAVQGRHFAGNAASGEPVPKTHRLAGLPEISLQTIALRDEAGFPRPGDRVVSDCEAAVAAAAMSGHAVLHAIDGSKTGLTAPGRAACRHLKARFGDRLSVVIDACQMRISPSAVRAYIEDGFAVLITGSKFFAAPGFCGAVVAPRGLTAHSLPADLHAYATNAGGLTARRCPGLLLRWTAALHSMQRFAAVPPDAVAEAIGRMTAAVRAGFAADPRLVPVAAPGPAHPSVLSFAIRSGSGTLLSAEALRPFYVALASDLCQIGQPVSLGSPAQGALRIAFSADQLADGGHAAAALPAVFAKLKRLSNLPQERAHLRLT